jgi:hypothetical protein
MSNKTVGGFDVIHIPVNNAATDTELVAAVVGKRVRLLACMIICDAAAGAKMSIVSGTANTELVSFSPSTYATGENTLRLDFCPVGWGETAVGEALDLRQTTTDDLDGVVVAQLVDP